MSWPQEQLEKVNILLIKKDQTVKCKKLLLQGRLLEITKTLLPLFLNKRRKIISMVLAKELHSRDTKVHSR